MRSSVPVAPPPASAAVTEVGEVGASGARGATGLLAIPADVTPAKPASAFPLAPVLGGVESVGIAAPGSNSGGAGTREAPGAPSTLSMSMSGDAERGGGGGGARGADADDGGEGGGGSAGGREDRERADPPGEAEAPAARAGRVMGGSGRAEMTSPSSSTVSPPIGASGGRGEVGLAEGGGGGARGGVGEGAAAVRGCCDWDNGGRARPCAPVHAVSAPPLCAPRSLATAHDSPLSEWPSTPL